ncbi:MAG TPA: hypothetical protein VFF59_10345 [Anaerolineae bacterium]|jgi:hypothetical protein|nr:hypothetical protein [Anaerolineae bacterium]
MTTKPKRARKPTETEIDRIVIAQAEDEAAWENPVQVRRSHATTIAVSAELAARAAFFAKLHREKRVEDWLQRIIQERIDLEEAAFKAVKQNLAVS